ncbi:hypothetical protein TUM3794_20290 [Shewanella colwelliana]|uniref:DUF2007 domain-containing protein n=1 Tax=Shewanella colwelliana TaxID=23 RepID=A0ABQ4P1D6_SHECO|nr:hypothetical protein [Shewanella colwelliana]GIU40988.1 hypothetical protein TUM3794_20290 [Shewanella colwelliana]
MMCNETETRYQKISAAVAELEIKDAISFLSGMLGGMAYLGGHDIKFEDELMEVSIKIKQPQKLN